MLAFNINLEREGESMSTAPSVEDLCETGSTPLARIRVGRTMAMVIGTLLKSGHEPVTAADIRSATGLPPGNVSPALVALRRVGVIESRNHPTGTYVGRDGAVHPQQLYILTNEGKTWANEAMIAFATKPHRRVNIWTVFPHRSDGAAVPAG
jgi:predicted transcriptional regulator